MLEGEGVRSMTALFLQMWCILRQPEFEQFLSDPIPAAANAKGFVVPYGDCPLDGERVGEMVYMDMLNRARKYVHIITPYLILDGELETALRFAAERGVDVHLILPGKPDKWFVYALAKTHYKALISSGVKISEWQPGFTHAKIVIADGVEAWQAPSIWTTAACTITLKTRSGCAAPTALPTWKRIFRIRSPGAAGWSGRKKASGRAKSCCIWRASCSSSLRRWCERLPPLWLRNQTGEALNTKKARCLSTAGLLLPI